MISFANPSFLWALTGLLIPVGIHLLSRKEGRIVKVGSLRHVEDSNTSQFKSIRLNEILLLLLRCLMIAWLVMFLSGAQCTNAIFKTSTKWVVIEKGLEEREDLKHQLDSLENQGYELRVLADGFPPVAEINSDASSANYWSLAEQLKKKADHDIIVFAYNTLEKFHGKRIALPENIRWISVSVQPDDHHFIATAIRFSKDSVLARVGATSAMETSFRTVKLKTNLEWFSLPKMQDSVKIITGDAIIISVVNDPAFNYDREILLAALKTIQHELKLSLTIKNEIDQDTDWIFWLSDQLFTPKSARAVIFKSMPHHSLFEHENDSIWNLTRHLNEEVALKENLTVELFKVLFSSEDQSTNPKKNDHRVLPDQMAWASTNAFEEATPSKEEGADFGRYLVLLFILTWIAERTLAIRRNQ